MTVKLLPFDAASGETHLMHPRTTATDAADTSARRAIQPTLEEQYRDDPSEAVHHVSARADWRDVGMTTSVDAWSGRVLAGLPSAAGGDDSDAAPGDMLLEALLASTGVTMRSVAALMHLTVRRADLSAEADFDARGTLGIDPDVPVGVTGVSVTAILETDATDDELDQLARTTERQCLVGQSLTTAPTISVRRATT